MLVIISDLHFTDGTTSNKAGGKDLFNVSPEAFRLLLATVSDIVRRKHENGIVLSGVTFVYNGDIFDPLRSYRWLKGAPKKACPWHVPFDKKACCAEAHRIFKRIVTYNREALEWLSGTHTAFSAVWKHSIEPTRIYIPGNHDRVLNLHPPSRALIQQALLGGSGSRRFRNHHLDQHHQALVMHGHESDPYNCELDREGRPRYREPPIGDPMTTLLFARLGHVVGALDVPEEAKARFRDIDNVRPALASVRFVQDIIRDFDIRGTVEGALRKVVDTFERLDFYDQWQRKHDRWGLGWDEADKLQGALRAIRLVGTAIPAGLLERLAALLSSDADQAWAKRRLEDPLAQGMRFCVLGHTHEPRHVPLFHRDGIERHYLNSGTFRTTYGLTFDKQDFARFQRMSFVIIYGPGEFAKNDETPAYEMWSGLRSRH